ncbi:MAG: hypothetical protein JSU01_08655, partial [Bacteroidetes bacterium]|nr:hypothetical protein [Bacteroidota bacterium]
KRMPPDVSKKLDSLMKEVALLTPTHKESPPAKNEKGTNDVSNSPASGKGKDSAANKLAPSAQPPIDTGDPAAEAAARQKKNTLIFSLLNGPQKLNDTTWSKDKAKHKNNDTTVSREQGIGHITKVLGFYNAYSKNHINGNYFKLITTFVYESNEVDDPAPNLGPNYIVIDSARRSGDDIVFSVYNTSAQSTAKLMSSRAAQDTVIRRAMYWAAQIGASGINIDLTGLTQSQRGNFVMFIRSLWERCRAAPPQYYITITMPGDDKGVAYDLGSLNKTTSYFIMDFSRSNGTPGALAPLNDKSSNSIQSCFSLYLSWDPYIPPSKFILGVPYRGVQWVSRPRARPQYQYVSYQDVRSMYADSAASYEPGLSAAYITADYKNTTTELWYDDDMTLGAKYDFALNSALGGIAIKYLGDDGLNGYLQQELAYKLVKIDTSITAVHISGKHGPSFVDFFEFLIKSPCNSETIEHLNNHKYYSNLLLTLNIIVIAVMIIVAAIRFFQIKKLSSSWPFKKLFTNVVIGLAVLESLLLLLFLFVWPGNPYFGNNASHKCIDVSFSILFIILFAGTIAGFLLRWLYQLNYKDDRP